MEKHEKMLEKVRALLAKADSTEFEGEAEVFRQKADQLMEQYAIDQWMVENAQAAVGARPKPVKKMLDFDWWYKSSQSNHLWGMFLSVARHCRVVVAVRGHGKDGNPYSQMPVIGLESDIQYFDLLFTSLMLQMGKQLEPGIDGITDLGEAVFTLRQAGISWPRITQKVYQAGLVKLTAKELATVNEIRAGRLFTFENGSDPLAADEVTWEILSDYFMEDVRTNIKNRLANANRAYIKRTGKQADRNYVKPAVYQRSFAYGFVERVSVRLRDMESQNRKRHDTEHQAQSMELVLRDIYDQALDLYREMYPPEEIAATGRRSRGRTVTRAYSNAGMDAGRDAGDRANLSVKPGKGVGGGKGALPKG